MKNILVTGATGPLGMAVVENLLKNISTEHIHVLARNAEKAAPLKEKGVDVRIGDYENYDSLINAFNGIETIYMISNNEVQNRIANRIMLLGPLWKQVLYTLSIPAFSVKMERPAHQ